MKAFIPIFLSFILSVIISIGIIIHSYYFAADNFGEHHFLAFVFVAVTEIAFISLPYIAAIHKKTRLDSFYVILLYILSVIPATIQVSSFWFKTQTEKVIARPAEPVKSVLAEKYNIRLTSIDNQLDKNSLIIERIAKDSTGDQARFVSYRTKDYRNQNMELVKQQLDLTNKIGNLDGDYELEYKQYQKDVKVFEKTNKKDNINILSDAMKLFYSLILVVILQLVNARFAFHGSKLLNRLKGIEDQDPTKIDLIPKDFKIHPILKGKEWLDWFNKHNHGDHLGPTEPGYKPEDSNEIHRKDWRKYMEADSIETDRVKIHVDKMLKLRNTASFKNFIFGDTKEPNINHVAEEIEKQNIQYPEEQVIEDIPKKPKEDGLYSDQPEVNLNPVKPLEYLQKHKIKGIGDQTLNKFIQHYKLKNTSLLNTFINKEDYSTLLLKAGLFPEATVIKLIEMLDNIKNR